MYLTERPSAKKRLTQVRGPPKRESGNESTLDADFGGCN